VTVLHITNGDGAAGLIKASAVAGDVLPWRDPMHHGPFPAGLSMAEASATRASYLAGDMLDPSKVAADFQQRDAHLARAGGYDEVVLWFEHDLLDQVQILQLLDWFAAANQVRCPVTLICIDRFPGFELFRGLGELNPAQIASLYSSRQPVTDAQYALAQAGWVAFCAPEPTPIEQFLQQDLSPLPFLHAALARHLEEFPCAHDGLTRTERQILTLVAGGVESPAAVFAENLQLELVLHLGDWGTYSLIERLTAGPNPLLHCAPDGRFAFRAGVDPQRLREPSLRLTALGRQVLGGVHVKTGQPLWTWSGDKYRLCLRR
jgi:hypothetical protein